MSFIDERYLDLSEEGKLLFGSSAEEARAKKKKRRTALLIGLGALAAVLVLVFALWGSGGMADLGETQAVEAQDGSYTIDIPSAWRLYNEDMGDYFSAASDDGKYFFILMRVAKADLDPDYRKGEYIDWVFSLYLEGDTDESLKGQPVESAYSLNGRKMRELRFSHISDQGEDYEEALIICANEEYFYIMNFFCNSADLKNGNKVKRTLLHSFRPTTEHDLMVYGENDSLSYISNQTYEVSDADALAALQIYADWQETTVNSSAGQIMAYYNSFQSKSFSLFAEDKDDYTSGTDFDAYCSHWQKEIKDEGGTSNREVISGEKVSLGGLNAYRIVFNQYIYMEGQTALVYLVEGEDNYYQLYFYASCSRFDRHLREFENIASSFQEL